MSAKRDNEDYVRARGILAMIGSAVFTGVAGRFFAIYLNVASPDAFGFGGLSLVLVGGVGMILFSDSRRAELSGCSGALA